MRGPDCRNYSQNFINQSFTTQGLDTGRQLIVQTGRMSQIMGLAYFSLKIQKHMATGRVRRKSLKHSSKITTTWHAASTCVDWTSVNYNHNSSFNFWIFWINCKKLKFNLFFFWSVSANGSITCISAVTLHNWNSAVLNMAHSHAVLCL